MAGSGWHAARRGAQRALCGAGAFLVFAAAGLQANPGRAQTAQAAANAGESIYKRGITGSGKPLEGKRGAEGVRAEGRQAACFNCHRRSGLGGREGKLLVPPITTRYLFNPRARDGGGIGLPYVEAMRPDREPYTDATIARAIREGVDSEGRTLNTLMPRFALDDADMASLVGYLKQLDRRKLPGVTDTVLHFATVITPDADPVKRAGVLNVIEQFVVDRNSRQMAASPRLSTTRKQMFMVHRQWQLHVWELTGPEALWQAQLERHLAKTPVLAVISGLGGTTWAPVHAFCEREALPCLFPNVEAPTVDADQSFYNVYFSRGVQLEADLIAAAMMESGRAGKLRTVKQVFRAGDSGEAGARALAAALKRHGVESVNAMLEGKPEANLAGVLGKGAGTGALVLWLRPDDLKSLGAPPDAPGGIYMSGLMGGLERAPLPAAWRERALIAYPFDLPDKRRARANYALGWFRMRQIPLVAEQEQTDTFLACGLLAETLSHMVDTFVRDYLIERMEDMIERRIVTGLYPRLSLGAGQRFASKGGFVVRLAEPRGTRLVVEHEWRVP